MSETREGDALRRERPISKRRPAPSAPPREFVVALCVRDPSDAGTQPRASRGSSRAASGTRPKAAFGSRCGWRSFPLRRVLALALHPDADAGILTADVDVSGDAGLVRIYVCDPTGRQVGAGAAFAEEGSVPVGLNPQGKRGRPVACACGSISARCRWSPDDPCLYDIVVRFGTDAVRSYTAFRTVKVAPDGAGRFRFFLNGEPLLLRGVPRSGLLVRRPRMAPSDEALAFDIQAMKDAGFNMLRKLLKVEADRWYYHCDRRGMLVWQDMVVGRRRLRRVWETSYKPTLWRGSWDGYEDTSASHQRRLGSDDDAYQRQWLRECRGTVTHLRAHPSVVTWVLFNEGWGAIRRPGLRRGGSPAGSDASHRRRERLEVRPGRGRLPERAQLFPSACGLPRPA